MNRLRTLFSSRKQRTAQQAAAARTPSAPAASSSSADSGTSNSPYRLRRLSLQDDVSQVAGALTTTSWASSTSGAASSSSALTLGPLAPSASVPLGHAKSAAGAAPLHSNALRRSSLPARLDDAWLKSEAIMSNPPVFDNPLRRRGCCDHRHTSEMAQYRAEAIRRELACKPGVQQPVLAA